MESDPLGHDHVDSHILVQFSIFNQGLEFTAVFCASLHLEADRSATEGSRVYTERLKDPRQKPKSLCWKSGDDIQAKGEDWSSSKERNYIHPSSFPSIPSVSESP